MNLLTICCPEILLCVLVTGGFLGQQAPQGGTALGICNGCWRQRQGRQQYHNNKAHAFRNHIRYLLLGEEGNILPSLYLIPLGAYRE